MLNITLKDGTVMQFEGGSVLSLAEKISAGLARVALAAKVNGKVCDLSFVLDSDSEVEILTFDSEDGKKVYNTTNTAVQQTKTGTVLSTVASDKNAIGYISLGSLNDSVKVISVDGVVPSEATVLDGTYKIQRPFVVMTNANVTLNPITADFMNYLKSADTKAHAEAAGCIFLEDGAKRANEGSEPIDIVAYTKQASLPTGGKIVVRGSTSMEKFINAAAKAYANLYGVGAEEIFDIQLEGSSVGRKAVEDDTKGNVIGLSSASVNQADITSFNACLDAVVVIVHKDNADISNLTLKNLYDIFSGKVAKFSEIGE